MNALGIIFSNIHDDELRDLTNVRAFASVPFGGRYRLIDFVLSNMVNSGIIKVGVITKDRYLSLMDHLGSGKAWDLDRKRSGLFVFPPYAASADSGVYRGRLEALAGVMTFIRRSREKYVILADSDIICNMDFTDIFRQHEAKSADITVVYSKSVESEGQNASEKKVAYFLEPDERVSGLVVQNVQPGEQNIGLNIVVMERTLLERIVNESIAFSLLNFYRDFLQKRVGDFRVFGYRYNGFYARIDSISNYFDANMRLLEPAVRKELFSQNGNIYTKVRDSVPTRYGITADVKNSLVADGCVIEGEVEDCILFRGVRVAPGAKISKSIIMQDAVISNDANLEYVIADKNVIVKPGRRLIGYQSYPVVLRKGSAV